MRFFAILAFAVAYAAAAGCASNCTRDILNECTPAFQFDNDGDCYYINLAVGKLWKTSDMACNQSAPYDTAAATLFAESASFNITDNALTYVGKIASCDDSPAPRRADVPYTYLVKFEYASKASSSNPISQSDVCEHTITLLTDYPTCNTNELTSWRGRSNRASGGSGRRNRASNTDDNGDRRGGCATSPLFGLNVSAAPCQTGQCCGANFCFRDQHYGDCIAKGDGVTNPTFLPGSACADATCKPVYPGSGSGKGGVDVSLGSSLANAGDAVPAGGALEVEVLDANEGSTDIPAGAVADTAVVAFSVNRFAADGTDLHGYLPTGTWIEVTVESEALGGADIAVFRYDDVNSIWVNAAEDCASISSDVQITVEGIVYTVPICHTSSFVVTLSADGDDKDDKKGKAKVTKKVKPTKTATKTKAPKTVVKKEAAKKKKTAVAIGVGIAGAAVAVAGVGFLAKRRANNKKGKAPASPATADVAVVSV